VLKGGHKTGSKKALRLRNLLVIIQFAVSVVLITSTFLVHKQLHFVQGKRLGFEKEQIMCLQGSSDLTRQYDSFKAELAKNPNILNSTLASGTPASTGSVGGVDWEGEKPTIIYCGTTFVSIMIFWIPSDWKYRREGFFQENSRQM
jgi:putative ABC transport system permease protein